MALPLREKPFTVPQPIFSRFANIFLVDVFENALVPYPGDERSPSHYLALSYVWGKETLGFRVEGPGRLPELPRTISDSMAVAKCLGIKYLWVDAVCIDQGHDAKQREQLGYMAEVRRAVL